MTAKTTDQVRARNVRFTAGTLHVRLDDGREISLPLVGVPWLKWLTKATPKQRANWSLEPGGYAIYWPDLDDGIEVCHLLNPQPLGRCLTPAAAKEIVSLRGDEMARRRIEALAAKCDAGALTPRNGLNN